MHAEMIRSATRVPGLVLGLLLLATSSLALDAGSLVNDLASRTMDGRRTGTNGAELAADYLEELLLREGFPVAAGDTTHRQTFRFVASQNLIQAALGLDGSLVADSSWTVLEASADASFQDVEIVFCGYGIDDESLGWNDYGDSDLNGAVAMVVRQGPRGERPTDPEWEQAYLVEARVRAATRHGASALLLVDNPFDTQAEADRNSGSDPAFGDCGLPLLAMSARRAEALLPADGKKLAARLSLVNRRRKPAPPETLPHTLSLDLQIERNWRDGWNLVSMLPGSGRLASEWLVAGAHYDHLGHGPDGLGDLHPGADDNASGVAALLLAGRELLASWSTDRSAAGRRSLALVFFGGEELGKLGSRAFLEEATLPLEQVRLMLNLDMVGRLPDKGLDVLGLERWPQIASHVPRSSLVALNPAPGAPGGDHESFLAAGVPAVMLFTGAHQDYHTPGDTIDKLNISGIERVGELCAAWLDGLGTATLELDPPGFQAGQAQDSRPRVTAGIGIVPAYESTEEGGMLVKGVRPDSPADRAGLVAGDQILSVGDRPVANIFDYTFAIRKAAIGDTLVFEVLSSGHRERKDLVLEERKK